MHASNGQLKILCPAGWLQLPTSTLQENLPEIEFLYKSILSNYCAIMVDETLYEIADINIPKMKMIEDTKDLIDQSTHRSYNASESVLGSDVDDGNIIHSAKVATMMALDDIRIIYKLGWAW